MKKTFFVFLLSGLMLSLAMSALATNLSFSPASVNVKENESFSLTVKVDAQGVKNYTVKLELDYPADLLKVNSFNFGSSWMPLAGQSGYDLIDNENGLLIKTAGYPNGLDSTADFGTISFSAKKSGNGVIKTTSNTMTLNAQNENLLSGNPQVSVTISEKVVETTQKITGEVKETPTEQPKETISQEEKEEEEEITTTTTEEEGATTTEEGIEEEEEKHSLLAAVITLGTGSTIVGIIVCAILILVILFIIRKIYIKKKTANI